jgi:hypothetical protein
VLSKKEGREQTALRTYGIFDGVGRHNNLVVAAVPDYETWQKVNGSGKVDDYLDFLLEQENALFDGSDPVRVVRVPLDLEHYSAWLAKNSYWRDGPEARAAWALDVAENPKELSAVIRKNPVLPRAPENREEVLVYFAVLVFPLDSINEAGKLALKFDTTTAEEIARVVEKAVPGKPEFKKVSRLRADGMRAVVGNRLILLPNLNEVESYLESVVPVVREKTVDIPRQFKITKSDLEDVEFPAYVAAFLPVAFHGAADVLDFWEEYLVSKSRILPELTGALTVALQKTAGALSPVGVMPLVTQHEVEFYLDWLFNLDMQPEADGKKEDKKPAKKNSSLKRIK